MQTNRPMPSKLLDMAKRVGRLGVECKGFEDKFLNETKLFAELFSARVSRGIGKKKKKM